MRVRASTSLSISCSFSSASGVICSASAPAFAGLLRFPRLSLALASAALLPRPVAGFVTERHAPAHSTSSSSRSSAVIDAAGPAAEEEDLVDFGVEAQRIGIGPPEQGSRAAARGRRSAVVRRAAGTARRGVHRRQGEGGGEEHEQTDATRIENASTTSFSAPSKLLREQDVERDTRREFLEESDSVARIGIASRLHRHLRRDGEEEDHGEALSRPVPLVQLDAPPDPPEPPGSNMLWSSTLARIAFPFSSPRPVASSFLSFGIGSSSEDNVSIQAPDATMGGLSLVGVILVAAMSYQLGTTIAKGQGGGAEVQIVLEILKRFSPEVHERVSVAYKLQQALAPEATEVLLKSLANGEDYEKFLHDLPPGALDHHDGPEAPGFLFGSGKFDGAGSMDNQVDFSKFKDAGANTGGPQAEKKGAAPAAKKSAPPPASSSAGGGNKKPISPPRGAGGGTGSSDIRAHGNELVIAGRGTSGLNLRKKAGKRTIKRPGDPPSPPKHVRFRDELRDARAQRGRESINFIADRDTDKANLEAFAAQLALVEKEKADRAVNDDEDEYDD